MYASMESNSLMPLWCWKTNAPSHCGTIAEKKNDGVTIGMDALARVLAVVYTWRGAAARIISARPATPNESRQYLENS